MEPAEFRRLRERLGVGPKTLADQLDTTWDRIDRIERGEERSLSPDDQGKRTRVPNHMAYALQWLLRLGTKT